MDACSTVVASSMAVDGSLRQFVYEPWPRLRGEMACQHEWAGQGGAEDGREVTAGLEERADNGTGGVWRGNYGCWGC